jgi:putative membrane protein
MISYNPKEWFTFLFRFHKSDTLRELFPLMVGVGIYAAFVTWLLLDYVHLPDSSVIHKTNVVHSTLGLCYRYCWHFVLIRLMSAGGKGVNFGVVW